MLLNKIKTAFRKIGGFFMRHCEIFRSNLELFPAIRYIFSKASSLQKAGSLRKGCRYYLG
jgi:hypothetical protein